MQINQRAHEAYRRAQVTSDNGLRIVVLLYDGAIGFCRQAEERFEEPAVRGHALGRAHRIVAELLAALDMERGGEIATNLDRLYRWMLDTLTEANVSGDRPGLTAVIGVLDALASGWRTIESQGYGSTAAP